MLFPKFQIRTMLLATAGAGLFFFAAARALRGETWPVVLVAAVAFGVAGLAVQAGLFGICWLLAQATGRSSDSATARVAYPNSEYGHAIPVRPAPHPPRQTPDEASR